MTESKMKGKHRKNSSKENFTIAMWFWASRQPMRRVKYLCSTCFAWSRIEWLMPTLDAMPWTEKNKLKYLDQRRRTYDIHVKGDMPDCFGWHTSVHQQMRTTILESITYCHMIFRDRRGHVRMKCPLVQPPEPLKIVQKQGVLSNGFWR